jgi:hypothetical protein
MKKNSKIFIFTNENQASVSGSVKRGEPTRSSEENSNNPSDQYAKVAVNKLQTNMVQFIENIGSIIDSTPKEVGGLTLDEIEIHANIDSKGNVGLLGIFSAELAMQGGIKFVLRRNNMKKQL